MSFFLEGGLQLLLVLLEAARHIPRGFHGPRGRFPRAGRGAAFPAWAQSELRASHGVKGGLFPKRRFLQTWWVCGFHDNQESTGVQIWIIYCITLKGFPWFYKKWQPNSDFPQPFDHKNWWLEPPHRLKLPVGLKLRELWHHGGITKQRI